MSILKLPCCIIRGGTSKGVFINAKYLPEDLEEKNKLLLSLFGSPDIRQIDGLGGADPLTSKVAIVYQSSRENVDVEFLAAEIGIKEATVNYGIMCGNTSSGVGYFAIDQGLVKAQSPNTTVRIYCRNNNKMIISQIPAKDEIPVVEGDYEISGVPGTASATELEFLDPAGAVTGYLLPTGNVIDHISIGDRDIEFSAVDSGTLYVFVNAENLGLDGCEPPDQLDNDTNFKEMINDVRHKIANYLNNINKNVNITAARIKIAIISKPREYKTLQDVAIKKSDIDIVAIIANPLKVHKAYAVSGGICLATASVINGTLVNIISQSQASPAVIKIGHPSGIMDVSVSFEEANEGLTILGAIVKRTARILMSGTAYVKL